MTFLISTALLWSVFNSVAVILQPLIEPFGFTQSDSGSFGGLTMLSGLFGAAVWGGYTQKTRKYRKAILICSAVSFLSLSATTGMLYT